MSRHGPSRSGFDLFDNERANLDAATVFRPRLARVRGLIAGIGQVTSIVQRNGPLLMRSAISVSRKLARASRVPQDRDRLRRRGQRPAHRAVLSRWVGEDEAVEAIVALLRVAAGPGSAFAPSRRKPRIRDEPSRISSSRRAPCSRRRSGARGRPRASRRKERRVDHRHAPFLAVRRRDHRPKPRTRTLESSAFGLACQIEAPDHGIVPCTKT